MSSGREVVVLSGTRTAIGDYGGALKDVAPTELAAHVIKEAAKRSKLDAKEIGACVLGNVIHTEAKDMYFSRVAALKGGLSEDSTALTVNRLCGSGMQAIVSASQMIMLGDADTMDCSPEPHSRFTVRHGVPTGMPASSAATRDRYMSFASPWITLPMTTWPTRAGSTFARATASLIAIAPSFVAAISFSAPP